MFNFYKVLTVVTLFSFFSAKAQRHPLLQRSAMATDAGIAALVSPSFTGCYSASVPVVVTIQNFGTNPLSNIPVNIYISGPASQTINATYPGPLPVGSTANFNAGNANMILGGVYTFTSVTSMPGDGNVNNDVNVTTRTVSPVINISGSSVLCIGNSGTLTASGASTYTWSTGSNDASITINPTVTTTYSVAGTNTMGCIAAYILTVSVQDPTVAPVGALACGSPAFGTLTANTFSTAVVSWYATPTSTTALGTGTSFPVNAVATTTYYAEANSVTNGSLFTTLAAGNGASGNMFDITATNSITVSGFDMHFNGVNTTTVEVWYRSGSFVGFENSNTGWTLAMTSTLVTNGIGMLTPIPGTMAIAIPAGQTYGIYVTVNGGSGMNYTNGNNLGNLYASNVDVQLFEGKGGAYFNVTSSPRIFNGVLKYTKPGCSSPRVPATFTVVPNLNVTAIGSHSAVCSGSFVTLTAGGAVNYTWSPAGDLSPSPNGTTVQASPTVNTTYSVVGTIPGCPQIDTATFSIVIFPAPSLSVSPPVYVIPGTFVNVSATGAASYSWQPGGSNNNNILVNPNVTTVYTVTGSNGFGCQSVATTTVFMSEVGLDEYSSEDPSLKAYPNPGNGWITISTKKSAVNYIFIIYDISGKIVFSKKLDKQENVVDMTALENGMYIYCIRNAETASMAKQGKLVKQ